MKVVREWALSQGISQARRKVASNQQTTPWFYKMNSEQDLFWYNLTFFALKSHLNNPFPLIQKYLVLIINREILILKISNIQSCQRKLCSVHKYTIPQENEHKFYDLLLEKQIKQKAKISVSYLHASSDHQCFHVHFQFHK